MSNFRVVIHHRISALHRDTSAGVWGGGTEYLHKLLWSRAERWSSSSRLLVFLVALGLAALACRNGVG